MVVGFYIVSVVALPLALGAFVVFTGMPRTRRCPSCGGETVPVRSAAHRLLSRVIRPTLSRRWCTTCLWQGTVRLDPRPTAPSRWRGAAPLVPLAPSVPDADGRPIRPGGLGIRRVEIDGDDWQVQVQCWAEGHAWRGRLIFVGPGGRSWCEHEPQLSGRTAIEVLSRALSVPEPALVGRIKKVARPS
jgi:hypothetical protein